MCKFLHLTVNVRPWQCPAVTFYFNYVVYVLWTVLFLFFTLLRTCFLVQGSMVTWLVVVFSNACSVSRQNMPLIFPLLFALLWACWTAHPFKLESTSFLLRSWVCVFKILSLLMEKRPKPVQKRFKTSVLMSRISHLKFPLIE